MGYFLGRTFYFLGILLAGLFPCTVNGQVATHLVISQAFGGGGTSAPDPTNDFVELYNPTAIAVSLTGWTLQYSPGTLTSWTVIALSGTVPAQSYFLITLGSNNTLIGTAMPLADLSVGAPNILSSSIKLALVSNTTPLTGQQGPNGATVDFIGTGIAGGFEGAGAASVGTNTASWLRKANTSSTAATMVTVGTDVGKGNGWDADNNSADFVLETVILARNSAVMVTLPVIFIGLGASRQERNIRIDWTVGEESGIDSYVVERSSDGTHFAGVVSIPAGPASEGTHKYSWTDMAPDAGGPNFYRIKAVQTGLAPLYSTVVEIRTGTGQPLLSLYPNPVMAGQSVSLHFENEPVGTYMATLINMMGQPVSTRVITYAGGVATESLDMDAALPRGAYVLKISNGRQLLSSLSLIRQ